jgi:hypothetical protein
MNIDAKIFLLRERASITKQICSDSELQKKTAENDHPSQVVGVLVDCMKASF